MPKRKITATARPAFWPCGSCRRNCSNNAICCDSCKQWFHTDCENFPSEFLVHFERPNVTYACNACFSVEVGGGHYNFAMGLNRLLQRQYGDQALTFAAGREKMHLPEFDHYGKPPISSEFLEVSEIDYNAKETMVKSRSNLENYGTPYLSSGNGNCLFNSISTALCGTEKLSTELRLRTSIEMIINAQRYKSRDDFDDLMTYSPSFEESTQACCNDGAFSSIWTLLALATVIGSPIQSLYPRLNSDRDRTHVVLTLMACTEMTKERSPFTILWTHMGPKPKKTWTANHFVPVLGGSMPPAIEEESLRIPKDEDNQTIPIVKQETSQILQTGNARRVSAADVSFASTINSTSTPILGKRKHDFSLTDDEGNRLKITKIEPKAVPTELHETTIFVADNATEENNNSLKPEETCNETGSSADVSLTNTTSFVEENDMLPVPDCVRPLPQGRWHNADQIFNLVTRPYSVQKDVPPGDKSNCYLFVDNTRNMSVNLPNKKRCDFYDDCGTWISEKGNSVKTMYIETNGMLRVTEKKNNLYCFKKREQKQVKWIPHDPQPLESSIVILSRY